MVAALASRGRVVTPKREAISFNWTGQGFRLSCVVVTESDSRHPASTKCCIAHCKLACRTQVCSLISPCLGGPGAERLRLLLDSLLQGLVPTHLPLIGSGTLKLSVGLTLLFIFGESVNLKALPKPFIGLHCDVGHRSRRQWMLSLSRLLKDAGEVFKFCTIGLRSCRPFVFRHGNLLGGPGIFGVAT